MTPDQGRAGDAPYLSLVIPIYNERENLKPLTDQLLSALSATRRAR